VKGGLVTGEAAPGCGVTVHVVRLPGKAGTGQTFWDSSWDAAIRRAADHATASILPRTRLCRSPWSGWRGFHLPWTLFHCYERAAELERERRYDEALDLYYKALEQEPMNLGLRLQIGFLQEKLALFADALATYESILEVARPGRNAVGAESGDATPAAVAADNPRTSCSAVDRAAIA
jgi:tetratricopeptide (TPR) repeat protein